MNASLSKRTLRAGRDYRSIAAPAGSVVVGFGLATAGCAFVGGLFDRFELNKLDIDQVPIEQLPWLHMVDAALGRGVSALLLSALLTCTLGISLLIYGRKHRRDAFSRREAILTVGVIWLCAGLCGAIPLMIGGGLSPTRALFEALSGLTTTGATIITDIEGTLSRPLLLWRSLLQWLGGMGIVVLFVAVFPNVGAGGRHMYSAEVPGTSAEGLTPRIRETSFTLWRIYVGFTIVETLMLWAVGLRPFEALCHALTTMSTGGFSTRDASVAAFENPAAEWVIGTFMLIASVNFGLYYTALRQRGLRSFWRALEFRLFLLIVAVSTLFLTLIKLPGTGHNVFRSLRHAYFTVATFISSTGYGIDDYMAYPGVGLALVVVLMFVGGCSGSTAGGIKIERVILLLKTARMQLRQSFRPNVVHVVRQGKRVVDPQILSDVSAFFVVFMISLAAGVFLICALERASLPQVFGAVLTCLSNMGPAPFYADGDHFAGYSSPSLMVFSFLMVLGRLEFFTLLALFVPSFWKR